MIRFFSSQREKPGHPLATAETALNSPLRSWPTSVAFRFGHVIGLRHANPALWVASPTGITFLKR